MSKRVWTKAQQNAIDARKGTVLVSAAAGSGKTSVLVQRLIERLTDSENSCPADKILVVTFTKAAASEMKERTAQAIAKLIMEQPQNKNLQKQQMLLPQMKICTIDSFCSQICKEYFSILNIPQNFQIVQGSNQDSLMLEAVREVIKKRMEQGNYILADLFSSEKTDFGLYQKIINLHKYANSHQDPKDWLIKKSEMYNNKTNVDIENTDWGKILWNEVYQALCYLFEICSINCNIVNDQEVLITNYKDTIDNDFESIKSVYENFEIKTWDENVKAIEDIEFGELSRISPKDVKSMGEDKYLKDNVLENRKTLKSIIANLKTIFSEDTISCKEDIENAYPIIKELCDATIDFSQEYKNLKDKNNSLDYADLEHLTFVLLADKSDKIIVPSKIALSISENFDEIMIDEYQDTNEVQDSIFNLISKQENNKFMVGDVKQCIYSFRQAMPEIFINYMEKYTPYDEKEIYPALINLDQNFRSRDTVIDSANFIFSCLMSKEVGGVDYTGGQRLVAGASYPKNENCKTEITFINKVKDENDDITEAKYIASKINELIESKFMVYDNGVQRPITYSDICILQRNINSHIAEYSKVLKECLVPTSVQVNEFFDSSEIRQVIAFLQVIDNPNQDIPLLSALMGPVYGFTANELAKIRSENNRISIWSSIIGDKSGKFDKFKEDINSLRLMASCMPSDLFIDMLYQRTNYLDYVSAMPNGEIRSANLKLLRQYASEYESFGYIGLAGFVRFIDKLRQNRAEIEGAQVNNSDENTVKIMSIHKSKGLEFPVCIISGCGRSKNSMGSDVVLNSKLGIGIQLKKYAGIKYSNSMREAIKVLNNQDEISEELRILYVGATRAKEKLIFVSVVSDIEKDANAVLPMLTSNDKVNPYNVRMAKSFSKWILMCVLKHKDGKELRELIHADNSIVCKNENSDWIVNFTVKEDKKADEKTDEKPSETADNIRQKPVINEELVKKIREKINFKYDNKNQENLLAKITASAVASHQANRKIILPRPAFMMEDGLTSAEKGTALHEFLQYCDFKKASTEPEKEIQRLVEKGFISETQSKVVELEKIKAFLNGTLGQRICNSENYEKEFNFSSRIAGNFLDKDYDGDKEIILQGAVDCLFVEDGKLVVVDFKSDRIKKPEILKEHYGIQLKLYAKALEKIKNMPVKNCYLYSFEMGKEIEI